MRASLRILPIVAAGALGVLSTAPAFAQDAAFSWTGFYVGLDGGYGWTDPDAVRLSADDVTPGNLGDSFAPSRGTIGNLDAQSWFAGGQIGVNGQMGHIVMGIEGDMQGADFHDTQAGVFTNPNGIYNPINGNASLNINWFGTVRGRLGVAVNRFMVYGTGGLAFADVDYQVNAIEGGAPHSSRLSFTPTKSRAALRSAAAWRWALRETSASRASTSSSTSET